MTYTYTINEYKYKVCLGFSIYFYARTDEMADQMKQLYEKGMNLTLKLKRKRQGYIEQPPYEMEMEQLEILRKGNEKYE